MPLDSNTELTSAGTMQLGGCQSSGDASSPPGERDAHVAFLHAPNGSLTGGRRRRRHRHAQATRRRFYSCANCIVPAKKHAATVMASYGGPNQKPRPLGGDNLLFHFENLKLRDTATAGLQVKRKNSKARARHDANTGDDWLNEKSARERRRQLKGDRFCG